MNIAIVAHILEEADKRQEQGKPARPSIIYSLHCGRRDIVVPQEILDHETIQGETDRGEVIYISAPAITTISVRWK